MQKRLRETAHFWAVQLGQSDKVVRRALARVDPDGMRGKGQPTYTLAKVFEALVPKGDPGEYDDQRQRLAAAQAEKVERENLVRAGELIEVPEVVRGWGEHIAAARAKLLAMPMKLGPQMLNITDAGVAAGKIRVEVHAALTELAQWTP